jgi:hypothetical protein
VSSVEAISAAIIGHIGGTVYGEPHHQRQGAPQQEGFAWYTRNYSTVERWSAKQPFGASCSRDFDNFLGVIHGATGARSIQGGSTEGIYYRCQ